MGTMQKSINSRSYANLRQWLRQSRESLGLSMRDLGELISEPHSFIGKVESGERRLDVFEYVQYCAALSINPEDGIKILTE